VKAQKTTFGCRFAQYSYTYRIGGGKWREMGREKERKRFLKIPTKKDRPSRFNNGWRTKFE